MDAFARPAKAKPSIGHSPKNQKAAANKFAEPALPSLVPPSHPSATGFLPAQPLPSIQTARTASTRSPTKTHISRPRAQAHASLHAVRDTQERRLVRSRSRSQPGQAREADSRPGPFQKEHWSKARLATPTTCDQAHSFYRTHHRPSIWVLHLRPLTIQHRSAPCRWKSGGLAPRSSPPKTQAAAPVPSDPTLQMPSESKPQPQG